MPLPLPAPGDAYPGLPVQVDTPQLEIQDSPISGFIPVVRNIFSILPGSGQPSERKGEFEASEGWVRNPPLRRPGIRSRSCREARGHARRHGLQPGSRFMAILARCAPCAHFGGQGARRRYDPSHGEPELAAARLCASLGAAGQHVRRIRRRGHGVARRDGAHGPDAVS